MFRRRRQRLDEEIDFHLARETAENIESGMDAREARNAALKTFGNPEVAKEKARELDPLYWFDALCQDTRFALRLIARNKWLNVAIIGTLTVGIGLNLSIFTLLNGLLLRPWVRTEPETFLTVVPRFSGNYQVRFSDYASMSQPDYVWYRDSSRSLKALAAYRVLPVTMTGEEAGSIRAGLVSCNFFDTIQPGLPLLGRYLASDECTDTAPKSIAILSEAFWRGTFSADPSVIGRVVVLNRTRFIVVGVAPSVMLPGPNAGPNRETSVWVPFTALGTLQPHDNYFSDVRAQWLALVGRRAPEHSLQQVQQELNILTHAADERVRGRSSVLVVTDGSVVHDPEMRSKAPIIFAVTLGFTSLLLLLACLNVTTLLLSRSAARQHEIAVRLAMGAGRFRLVRQLVTETLALSAISAVVSFLISEYAPDALWKALMNGPVPFPVKADWHVLAYATGITIVAGLIAGLSPASESLRLGLAETLKASAMATTDDRRTSRLRHILVAAQIAVSLFLLVYASLFARAQRSFYSYDPGFETRQVLSVPLASVLAGVAPSPSYYQELDSRVKAVPGVRSAAYASSAPWMGRNSAEVSIIDGKRVPASQDPRLDPLVRFVSPEYFRTLDIRLTVGRSFTDAERAQREPIPAVISETMARRYWPGMNPVGHYFGNAPVHEVIGVCRDVQSVDYMRDDGPVYYLPLAQQPAYMFARVDDNTQATATTIRSILHTLDTQMTTSVTTLDAVVQRQGDSLKPVVIFGAIAVGLALFLTLTGVYAIVSYSVSQRLREIAIRVALGAQRGNVICFVLCSGIQPVCGGVVLGLGLVLAASAATKALPFSMNPRDPIVLSVLALLMVIAALTAILIPACRAARHDPTSSLRNE